jgi:hypothetical protein
LGHRVSTPIPANLSQYRRRSKVRASRVWYRRSHFAILSRTGTDNYEDKPRRRGTHSGVLRMSRLPRVSRFWARWPCEANKEHEEEKCAGDGNCGSRKNKIRPEPLNQPGYEFQYQAHSQSVAEERQVRRPETGLLCAMHFWFSLPASRTLLFRFLSMAPSLFCTSGLSRLWSLIDSRLRIGAWPGEISENA